MGYDGRINAQFLNAGVGFGGSCFPKDVKALKHMAENSNSGTGLLGAVIEVNNLERTHFVGKVIQMLGGEAKGRKIGVLGLSFKPDTDDMRESPSIDIIAGLQAAGATIQAYDPIAMESSRQALTDVCYCNDAYEAATDVDALLLITAWNEFKQLDMEKVRSLMRGSVLVDGRNIYDPGELRDYGFTYAGVGRS